MESLGYGARRNGMGRALHGAPDLARGRPRPRPAWRAGTNAVTEFGGVSSVCRLAPRGPAARPVVEEPGAAETGAAEAELPPLLQSSATAAATSPSAASRHRTTLASSEKPISRSCAAAPRRPVAPSSVLGSLRREGAPTSAAPGSPGPCFASKRSSASASRARRAASASARLARMASSKAASGSAPPLSS